MLQDRKIGLKVPTFDDEIIMPQLAMQILDPLLIWCQLSSYQHSAATIQPAANTQLDITISDIILQLGEEPVRVCTITSIHTAFENGQLVEMREEHTPEACPELHHPRYDPEEEEEEEAICTRAEIHEAFENGEIKDLRKTYTPVECPEVHRSHWDSSSEEDSDEEWK